MYYQHLTVSLSFDCVINTGWARKMKWGLGRRKSLSKQFSFLKLWRTSRGSRRGKRYSGIDNLSSSCWLLDVWMFVYFNIWMFIYLNLWLQNVTCVRKFSSRKASHSSYNCEWLFLGNNMCVCVRERREKFQNKLVRVVCCWWRCRGRRILWTVQGR